MKMKMVCGGVGWGPASHVCSMGGHAMSVLLFLFIIILLFIFLYKISSYRNRGGNDDNRKKKKACRYETINALHHSKKKLVRLRWWKTHLVILLVGWLVWQLILSWLMCGGGVYTNGVSVDYCCGCSFEVAWLLLCCNSFFFFSFSRSFVLRFFKI